MKPRDKKNGDKKLKLSGKLKDRLKELKNKSNIESKPLD